MIGRRNALKAGAAALMAGLAAPSVVRAQPSSQGPIKAYLAEMKRA